MFNTLCLIGLVELLAAVCLATGYIKGRTKKALTLAMMLAVAASVIPISWDYTVENVRLAKSRGVYASPIDRLRERTISAVESDWHTEVVRLEVYEPEPYTWLWVLKEPNLQCVRVVIWTSARERPYGGPSCYLRVQGGWAPISIEEPVWPEYVALWARVFQIQ